MVGHNAAERLGAIEVRGVAAVAIRVGAREVVVVAHVARDAGTRQVRSRQRPARDRVVEGVVGPGNHVMASGAVDRGEGGARR